MVLRNISVIQGSAGRRRLLSYSASPLAIALVLGTVGLTGGSAHAADGAAIQKLESEIQSLEARHEAEVKELQNEIAQLKSQQATTQSQVQATQSAVTATQTQIVTATQALTPVANQAKVVETASHSFQLTSADGQNSIALTGRLMIDYGDYLNTAPEGGKSGTGPGAPGVSPLNSGVNARRGRVGVAGVFASDWSYRLIYDFGGSADSVTPGVSGSDTSGLENAYVTYNGFNKPGNDIPVAIEAGYMDVPWTLDEATSSNDIMFLERSSSQVVATAFGGGDFRSAIGLRSNNKDYWAGVYVTGPASGAPHTGADVGTNAILGRASYQVYQDDISSVHLGINAGQLLSSRGTSTATTATSIKATIGGQGLTLSDRPELRVDPTSILTTGAIPSHSGTVLGAEAAGGYENFFLQGEYYHYTVGQNAGGTNPSDGKADLVSPDLQFQGGYVEASYTFGGHRKYNPASGAYTGVIPDHPLSLADGNLGALEISARYSAINLNDKFTPGGTAPHVTGGVNGGDQTGIDVGLTWYPNTNMRFIIDYIDTDVADLYKPTTTGLASTTPAGARIQALGVRSQFNF